MARIEIRPAPGLDDVLAVTRNMRARDAEEIFALRWHDSPCHLAEEVMHAGEFRWGAYLDGRPIAMLGAFPQWPRVWSVWSFGTDEFRKVAPAMARHVKTFMIPALENAGAIRAFCWSMEAHTDACRWLEFLGAAPEVKLDKYGKNGQTFVCYGWTR